MHVLYTHTLWPIKLYIYEHACMYVDGDDFIDIAHELQGFEVNYYTLGRNLHLSRDKLAIIELNNHSSCVTAFGKVIDEWLSMNYTISRFGRPSWQLLVKAVNEIDHERAKVIANKHRIPMDQVYICLQTPCIHYCSYASVKLAYVAVTGRKRTLLISLIQLALLMLCFEHTAHELVYL